MSGEMMPKEQQEYIEKIQNHCLEATNMTENEAWHFAFRCWQLDYSRKKKKVEFLHFLGRGSCYNTKEGSNSAFIKHGSVLVLIDCGESTFADLMRLNERSNILDGVLNVYVLITHFHSDHIGSLPSLIYYSTFVQKADITLFTTDVETLSDIINKQLYLDMHEYDRVKAKLEYTLIKFYKMFTISMDGINLFVTPMKENHVEMSTGYVIEYIDPGNDDDACKIYYTGDTKYANNMAYNLRCDYYYMDSCNKDNSYPHQNVDNIAKTCDLYNIPHDRIRLMHIDDDTVFDKAKEYGFKWVQRVI